MSAIMRMCEIIPDCSVQMTAFLNSVMESNKDDRIQLIKNHISTKYPNENPDIWSYQDLCDYIESNINMVYTGSDPMYQSMKIESIVIKPAPFWSPTDALYIRKKKDQINKLLQISTPISFESIDGSKHVRIPFAEVRDKNGQRVYRQGWFFKNRFLDSVCQYRICTTVEELRKTLDDIIDVKKRRNDSDLDQSMNQRGVKAYQYFIKTFNTLSTQYPEKRYFVQISF